MIDRFSQGAGGPGTCFRRPQVPPTNNQAERSLRPLVITRKVIQGTRPTKVLTQATAQAQAALYRKPLKRRLALLRC